MIGSEHLADILNCEYQSGGDAETLCNVARRITGIIPDREVRGFLWAASAGGLDCWPEAREYDGEPVGDAS